MSQKFPIYNNSWCAPFSGANILVALGLEKQGDFSVVETIARQNKQAWDEGLPGNVSFLTSALETLYPGKINTKVFENYYEFDKMRAELKQGKAVIVNGSWDGGQGHYLVLLGVDEKGDFIVNDPWREEILRWKDKDVQEFMKWKEKQVGYATPWASVWRVA